MAVAKNQYGFQAAKSTAQPIFVTRRLIDVAESAGAPFFLLFLDWSKAFDSIIHDQIIMAIDRLNVPYETLEELKHFYEGPKWA